MAETHVTSEAVRAWEDAYLRFETPDQEVCKFTSRCIGADCRALPIRAASQDVAIVQGGLHHLPDVATDLPCVIEEVQRVLKPGGRFVVVEPWLTPFLRAVHAICARPARQMWGRLDALATMIDHEGEVYRRWLANPDFALTALTRAFAPERSQRQWGKLPFVGRRDAVASPRRFVL
jgi:ubiquinone/menaquinone biosynthesis C-methylase UbiE